MSDTSSKGAPERSGKGGGITRRQLLKTGAVAGVAGVVAGPAGVAAAVVQEPAPDGPPDLILTNGKIHTMDGSGTVLSSVAITGGKFVAIDRPGRGGPQTRSINLRGRTVIPGITEPHVHIVSLANRPGYHTPIETTASIAEVQEKLADRRPGVPEGQWITSMGGWHQNQWAERRFPTRAELDEAVPDRPVLLWLQFTGPAIVNSAGKAIFDAVDAGDLPHPDAVKINVADNGVIAGGVFGISPSTTALFLLRTWQTYEDKIRSTRDAMDLSAKVGVTALLDDVLFPTPGPLHPSQILSNLDHYRMYDSWLDLHRQGETIVRMQINFLHNQGNIPALGGLENQLPELKERLRNQFQFFGDDILRTGSIGEWAAPIGAGAVWQEAQRLVAQAQWRNENSVGSLAQLEQVVVAYEQMEAQFGISHLRWMVHHVPFLNTNQLDRLHAIGCAVQAAGYRWVTGTGSGVGAPFRTIYDHPIKMGLHGDGVHIAPLSPFPHLRYATTGLNSFGDQINAGQQLTRQEAMGLFTRENPWFLKMEDQIGTIEVGKLADLAVLSKDFFTVPDAELDKIESVLTIVDGKVVYDAGVVKG